MSNKNILIVDDDEELLNIYRNLLENEGYIVTIASTSRDALEWAKKKRFHLAILDIVLPDIQGDKLARELKTMYEAIQIIFITGYPEFQNCIDSLDLGIAEILLKPLTQSEIITATENALFACEEGTPIKEGGSSNILSTFINRLGRLSLSFSRDLSFRNHIRARIIRRN